MPRLRKAIFNGNVYFVTLSVEQGVMLPSNPLVNFLVESAMARAYKHHKLNICHYLVNGTHIHMLITIDDPEDLPNFMERFKTESSHYLNRLLGRKKRTIWCKGYDSPALLTKEDVVQKIIYLYINPVKDGLIGSIKNYPGVSSWRMFSENIRKKKLNLTSRNLIHQVPQNLTSKQYQRHSLSIKYQAKESIEFKLNPNSWMKRFGVERNEEQVNEAIKQEILEAERKIRKEREGKPFLGKYFLKNQGIDLTYIPERSGRKMWCISSDVSLRVRYIEFIKDLCESAKEAYKLIKNGVREIEFPLGLFPPRLMVRANLLFQDEFSEFCLNC